MASIPASVTAIASPWARLMGMATMANKKDAICDIRGPCQAIQRSFKPVFSQIQPIHYAYKLLDA